MVAEVPKPTLVIHLACKPQSELQRISRRQRKPEATIELPYLDRLNKAISRAVGDLRKNNTPTIEIDSDTVDFANDGKTQARVVAEVLAKAFSETEGPLIEPPTL